jgi:exopolyphosphatase/guanosine-5'-triphosphate,3'-diphosphate pyrophosphatase
LIHCNITLIWTIYFDLHTLNYLAAAIDLGSNSFHVTLVDTRDTPWRVVSRAGEKVQLAAGLDDQGYLSQEAIARGLGCLRRLASKLAKVAPNNRHVVATNTLRVAQNSTDFIVEAQLILGAPVRVLTGEEEAALIFCGVVGEVAATAYQNSEKLVIDIGGGSTELILGQHCPKRLQSFSMGCVAFSSQFFPQRKIDQSYIKNAVEAAQHTIITTAPSYLNDGWQVCIGSSGTIKALVALSGLLEDGIPYLNWASMAKIEQQILTFDYLDDVLIEGLRPDRGEVLPAGYAILKGIMLSLNLERVYFSTGALREGVLLRAQQPLT